MNILRSFRNGLMLGCTMSAEGVGEGGGGGGYQPAADSFAAGLAEDLRGNEAFRDVKDVNDLAARYADSRKPWSLPEKFVKDNPALKDFKSLDDFAGAYVNQSKLVGADKGRVALIPKDDAKPEEWQAFYAAQGRPEKADGYKLEVRADGKPYSEADKAFHKELFPVLHAMGVTQRQIAAGAPLWDKLQEGAATAYENGLKADMEQASAGLRTEWGADYDAKVGLATDALKHYSAELKLGDSVLQELDATKLGNNPGLTKLLSHIGGQLKEDGLLGKLEGGHGDVSAEQAKGKIQELEAAFRANDKFRDKNAPGRAEALAEISRLYDIAYPGEKQPV